MSGAPGRVPTDLAFVRDETDALLSRVSCRPFRPSRAMRSPAAIEKTRPRGSLLLPVRSGRSRGEMRERLAHATPRTG